MNEVGRSARLRGHPPGWAMLGQKLSVLTAAAMRLGWLSTAPKEPDTLCTQEKFMHVGMRVYISAQLRCSPVPPAADLCSRDAGRGKFFASVKCFSSPFLPLPAQHDPPLQQHSKTNILKSLFSSLPSHLLVFLDVSPASG